MAPTGGAPAAHITAGAGSAPAVTAPPSAPGRAAGPRSTRGDRAIEGGALGPFLEVLGKQIIPPCFRSRIRKWYLKPTERTASKPSESPFRRSKHPHSDHMELGFGIWESGALCAILGSGFRICELNHIFTKINSLAGYPRHQKWSGNHPLWRSPPCPPPTSPAWTCPRPTETARMRSAAAGPGPWRRRIAAEPIRARRPPASRRGPLRRVRPDIQRPRLCSDGHDRTRRSRRATSDSRERLRPVGPRLLPSRSAAASLCAACRGVARGWSTGARRGSIARGRPEPPGPAAPKRSFEAAAVRAAATEQTLVVPSEAWTPSAPLFPDDPGGAGPDPRPPRKASHGGRGGPTGSSPPLPPAA